MVLPVVGDERVGEIVCIEDPQQREEHEGVVNDPEGNGRAETPPENSARDQKRDQEQTRNEGVRGRSGVHPALVHRGEADWDERLFQIEPEAGAGHFQALPETERSDQGVGGDAVFFKPHGGDAGGEPEGEERDQAQEQGRGVAFSRRKP